MAFGGKMMTAAATVGALFMGSMVASVPASAQWHGGHNRGGYDRGYDSARDAERRCIAAVERQGGRYVNVDVRRANVERTRDGYRVTGVVRADSGRYGSRDGWRDGRHDDRRYSGRDYAQNGSFSCAVRHGRVDDVRVRGIRGLR